MDKLGKVIKKLESASEGIKAINAINNIADFAKFGHIEAINALAEYSVTGRFETGRFFSACRLADLAPISNYNLLSLFENGLNDNCISYPCIKGIARTSSERAFPALVKFVLNEDFSVENRAFATIQISIESNNPFNFGRPRKESEWKREDLPIELLREWQVDGFPRGSGAPKPNRDSLLDHPLNSFEEALASFDNKLNTVRELDPQNRTNPGNYLSPASPEVMSEICARWKLSEKYLKFLSCTSPTKFDCKITVPGNSSDFWLYSAEELICGQQNFATVKITGEVISDWPPNYLVIGQCFGDPIVLKLTNPTEPDSQVLTANHGMGNWKFKRLADSFESFIGILKVHLPIN